jgi:hypothetical protein
METLLGTCVHCGKIFVPLENNYGQRKRINLGLPVFCSNACRGKSMRKTDDRICVFCGESFYIKPKKLETGSGDFCSRKCFHDYQKSLLITKICPICHEVFTVSKSYDRLIHCSQECRKKSHQHVDKFCEYCGKFFGVFPYSSDRKFCSRSCGYNFRRIAKRHGEDSGPASMYYLRISSGGKLFYKIGVTSSSVQYRFRGQMHKIDIIRVEHFKSGLEAYEEERRILTKYADFRYMGPPLLYYGNSEIFTQDVLRLDVDLVFTFHPIQNPCLSLQVH